MPSMLGWKLSWIEFILHFMFYLVYGWNAFDNIKYLLELHNSLQQLFRIPFQLHFMSSWICFIRIIMSTCLSSCNLPIRSDMLHLQRILSYLLWTFNQRMLFLPYLLLRRDNLLRKLPTWKIQHKFIATKDMWIMLLSM